MNSIKERAKKEYPLEDGLEEAHWNTRQEYLREAYIKGATEQHKIDIEKACNAFCANCEVGRELCKSQNISCPEYKDFKKALED